MYKIINIPPEKCQCNILKSANYFILSLFVTKASHQNKHRLTLPEPRALRAVRSSEPALGVYLHPDWLRSTPFDLPFHESNSGKAGPTPDVRPGEVGSL